MTPQIHARMQACKALFDSPSAGEAAAARAAYARLVARHGEPHAADRFNTHIDASASKWQKDWSPENIFVDEMRAARVRENQRNILPHLEAFFFHRGLWLVHPLASMEQRFLLHDVKSKIVFTGTRGELICFAIGMGFEG